MKKIDYYNTLVEFVSTGIIAIIFNFVYIYTFDHYGRFMALFMISFLLFWNGIVFYEDKKFKEHETKKN